MKTLLLLRHAKSSRADSRLADHDRPLNDRGNEAAKLMGQLLADERLIPALSLSSTAVRARKTAAKVAKRCGYAKPVQLDERLYLTEPKRHLDVLRDIPDDCERVLVVGHNPGIAAFLNELTAADEELPTAALARIELPLEHWRDASAKTRGTLVRLWRPKEL